MSDERIENSLTDIGDALRPRPSVRGAVMRRVTEASRSIPPRRHRTPWSAAAFSRAWRPSPLVPLGATMLWGTGATGAGSGAGGLRGGDRERRAGANVFRPQDSSLGRRRAARDVGVGIKFREPDRERYEKVSREAPLP